MKVETGTEAVERLASRVNTVADGRCYGIAATLRALAAERDAAHARAERLEGALRPFAIAADDLDDLCWRDDSHCWESPAAMSVTAGDFRRARAALATQEGRDGE